MRKYIKYIVFGVVALVLTVVCILKIREVSEETISYMPITNKTIVLDAGHGGMDPGTYSGNIFEKELNLKIAKKLGDIFIQNNCFIYFSRTEDYDLSKEDSYNHKIDDLKKRAEMINFINPDLLISLHLNSLIDNSVFGPMVYYRYNDGISKQYAVSIQNYLNKLTGLEKIIHSEKYYLFMKTKVPAVLIECGFLSNQAERKKLCEEKYQQSIVEAIYQGVRMAKV